MKITDEQLIDAVQKNYSMADTIRFLGLRISGSSYKVLKGKISKLSISIEHWVPFNVKAAHLKVTIPLEDILIENSKYNSTDNLKKRLIKIGLLEEKCNRCNQLMWEGEKLSLHLDHINGVRTDNRIENLRLLCPNCHSITPTYCGKNNRYRECIDCNKRVEVKTRKRCNQCADVAHMKQVLGLAINRPTKIDWPTTEELLEKVSKSSYSAVGRELGVTDSAIRARIKNHP